ncbi:Edem2 [Bugula neritina]|uniref:alpha-1,2-Mannosidase n=1 Tax=Bugula neritina TaxID=10212 RepID=A0A7J7K7M9_BUGNE|nr:Edem2 [Bugula neritina]
MTYINQGPIMLNVDMHKPTSSSRNIMDSLLAFWPGLQVLKGDLRSAIEIHEVLYQITQRHNFLPEAVTTDFHVHWGQHPLRPEFVESTYFLYKATGDPHYLDVGRTVLENLEKHARVPCGFAAIKDVRGNTHEDQSYLPPGAVSTPSNQKHCLPRPLLSEHQRAEQYVYSEPTSQDRAVDFKAEDGTQMRVLTSMGVQVHQTADGRLQLSHVPGKATSSELAEEGLSFMKEMLELAQSQQEAVVDPRIVQIRPSDTTKPKVSLPAGSARFGWDFTLTPNTPNRHKVWEDGYRAPLVIAEPLQACEPLTNQDDISGKVALAQRGSCTFMEKARTCQNAGAVAAIIIDNIPGSNRKSSGVFQMSGDGEDDVFIAVVFLYSAEATTLLEPYKQDPQLEVYIARQAPKEPVVSEIKYPQFVVIYETPNLKLNVFEKEFSLSLTLQSRVPADISLSLQDSVEIEQQGDRHHIDLTAATPAYFNLETGVMPTTGVIFQITLDLLVEFLAECKGIAHQYTFLNHIASIGRYIKFVYMDEEANDGLTEKDYSNMMELIPVIVKCFGQLRGTSSDEQSQGQVDLEVSSEQEMEPEQEISNEQETENINTKTSSGAEEIIVTKPKSIRRDTNYVLATDPQQVKVVDVVEPSDIQSPKSINLDKDEL